MSLTKLSLDGINLIIPGQGGFGNDIPAGDGKPLTFFYSVWLDRVSYSRILNFTGTDTVVLLPT